MSPGSAARLLTLVGASMLAIAVGVWVAHQTDMLLRLDIVVLVLVMAETRGWSARVAAVVTGLVVAGLLPGVELASLLGYVLAVVVSALAAWALTREPADASASPPSRRFVRVAGELLLVGLAAATIAAVVPAVSDVSGWSSLTTLVAVVSALMLAAAIWSRPFAGDQSRWLSRLSLAFIIVGITVAVPFATVRYWAVREADSLGSAVASAASSLDSGLADSFNAFSARAGQPPRAPFADQEGFAAVNQPVLLGNADITSLALLVPTESGVKMLYEIDRLGTNPSWADLLGAAPADNDEVRRALQEQVPVSLGIRLVPDAAGEPRPNVVYLLPQASSTGAPTEVLAAAISVSEVMGRAIDAAGPDAPAINFTIDAASPDLTDPALPLSFGPAAVGGAVPVAAEQPLSLGDVPIVLTASAGTSFGDPVLQRALILTGEVLVGLFSLLLLLQAANSRFRFQRSLEQRQALLAAAIDAAPGLVLLIDRDRRVVMANSRTAEASLAGRPVLESMPFAVDADEGTRLSGVIAAALDGTASTVEHVDMGTGDTLRIHEVSATPVVSRAETDAAALIQVLDVTDSRSAAMRTAQSERLEALGAMAGGLAHDFNNLLFIINGYLQLMQNDERIKSQDDLGRYVEHAGDAAERGAEIAKSLLSVTRSQPLQASPVDLASFLQGIVPLARQALGEHRTLDLGITDGDLEVLVDPGQLSSSVINLVINARDATDVGGSVLISARRRTMPGDDAIQAGEYVEVAVTDDGEGMSPEVIRRAFEPFFSTKPVGQGSGLGLASVYSFARQSGGTALISSKPDAGTTVSILIPAASAPSGLASPGSGSRVGSRARVLVVDDEHTLAGLVAGWISDRGVDVRIANSMETALAVADEFQPDTLLTDMNIGADVDGLDVAARITLAHPDIDVIFMTGFSDRMVELQQRGMVTLAKPFGRAELYRVLFADDDARAAEMASTDDGHVVAG